MAATPLPAGEIASRIEEPQDSGMPGDKPDRSLPVLDTALAVSKETEGVERPTTPIEDQRAFLVKLTGLQPWQLEAFPDELPPLPVSRPTSPLLQTPEPPRGSLSERRLSSTSVPIRFRRPPASPGATRDDLRLDLKNASSPGSSPLRPPGPRHAKSHSSEFVHSREYRPLYLVERNRKSAEVEEEEVLPALPSSGSPSRASSASGTEDEYESAYESAHGSPSASVSDAFEDALADPFNFVPQHYSGPGPEVQHPELVDRDIEEVTESQQTTPKASSFPAGVLDVRHQGALPAENLSVRLEQIQHEEPKGLGLSMEEPAVSHGYLSSFVHDQFPGQGLPQFATPFMPHPPAQITPLAPSAPIDDVPGVRDISTPRSRDASPAKSSSRLQDAALGALVGGAAAAAVLHHRSSSPAASDDFMGGDLDQETIDAAASSAPIAGPSSPERPTLTRAPSSSSKKTKKGKKGSKGKSIDLAAEPPKELTAEDWAKIREDDAADAVEGWFDAPVEEPKALEEKEIEKEPIPVEVKHPEPSPELLRRESKGKGKAKKKGKGKKESISEAVEAPVVIPAEEVSRPALPDTVKDTVKDTEPAPFAGSSKDVPESSYDTGYVPGSSSSFIPTFNDNEDNWDRPLGEDDATLVGEPGAGMSPEMMSKEFKRQKLLDHTAPRADNAISVQRAVIGYGDDSPLAREMLASKLGQFEEPQVQKRESKLQLAAPTSIAIEPVARQAEPEPEETPREAVEDVATASSSKKDKKKGKKGKRGSQIVEAEPAALPSEPEVKPGADEVLPAAPSAQEQLEQDVLKPAFEDSSKSAPETIPSEVSKPTYDAGDVSQYLVADSPPAELADAQAAKDAAEIASEPVAAAATSDKKAKGKKAKPSTPEATSGWGKSFFGALGWGKKSSKADLKSAAKTPVEEKTENVPAPVTEERTSETAVVKDVAEVPLVRKISVEQAEAENNPVAQSKSSEDAKPKYDAGDVAQYLIADSESATPERSGTPAVEEPVLQTVSEIKAGPEQIALEPSAEASAESTRDVTDLAPLQTIPEPSAPVEEDEQEFAPSAKKKKDKKAKKSKRGSVAEAEALRDASSSAAKTEDVAEKKLDDDFASPREGISLEEPTIPSAAPVAESLQPAEPLREQIVVAEPEQSSSEPDLVEEKPQPTTELEIAAPSKKKGKKAKKGKRESVRLDAPVESEPSTPAEAAPEVPTENVEDVSRDISSGEEVRRADEAALPPTLEPAKSADVPVVDDKPIGEIPTPLEQQEDEWAPLAKKTKKKGKKGKSATEIESTATIEEASTPEVAPEPITIEPSDDNKAVESIDREIVSNTKPSDVGPLAEETVVEELAAQPEADVVAQDKPVDEVTVPVQEDSESVSKKDKKKRKKSKSVSVDDVVEPSSAGVEATEQQPLPAQSATAEPEAPPNDEPTRDLPSPEDTAVEQLPLSAETPAEAEPSVPLSKKDKKKAKKAAKRSSVLESESLTEPSTPDASEQIKELASPAEPSQDERDVSAVEKVTEEVQVPVQVGSEFVDDDKPTEGVSIPVQEQAEDEWAAPLSKKDKKKKAKKGKQAAAEPVAAETIEESKAPTEIIPNQDKREILEEPAQLEPITTTEDKPTDDISAPIEPPLEDVSITEDTAIEEASAPLSKKDKKKANEAAKRASVVDTEASTPPATPIESKSINDEASTDKTLGEMEPKLPEGHVDIDSSIKATLDEQKPESSSDAAVTEPAESATAKLIEEVPAPADSQVEDRTLEGASTPVDTQAEDEAAAPLSKKAKKKKGKKGKSVDVEPVAESLAEVEERKEPFADEQATVSIAPENEEGGLTEASAGVPIDEQQTLDTVGSYRIEASTAIPDESVENVAEAVAPVEDDEWAMPSKKDKKGKKAKSSEPSTPAVEQPTDPLAEFEDPIETEQYANAPLPQERDLADVSKLIESVPPATFETLVEEDAPATSSSKKNKKKKGKKGSISQDIEPQISSTPTTAEPIAEETKPRDITEATQPSETVAPIDEAGVKLSEPTQAESSVDDEKTVSQVPEPVVDAPAEETKTTSQPSEPVEDEWAGLSKKERKKKEKKEKKGKAASGTTTPVVAEVEADAREVPVGDSSKESNKPVDAQLISVDASAEPEAGGVAVQDFAVVPSEPSDTPATSEQIPAEPEAHATASDFPTETEVQPPVDEPDTKQEPTAPLSKKDKKKAKKAAKKGASETEMPQASKPSEEAAPHAEQPLLDAPIVSEPQDIAQPEVTPQEEATTLDQPASEIQAEVPSLEPESEQQNVDDLAISKKDKKKKKKSKSVSIVESEPATPAEEVPEPVLEKQPTELQAEAPLSGPVSVPTQEDDAAKEQQEPQAAETMVAEAPKSTWVDYVPPPPPARETATARKKRIAREKKEKEIWDEEQRERIAREEREASEAAEIARTADVSEQPASEAHVEKSKDLQVVEQVTEPTTEAPLEEQSRSLPEPGVENKEEESATVSNVDELSNDAGQEESQAAPLSKKDKKKAKKAKRASIAEESEPPTPVVSEEQPKEVPADEQIPEPSIPAAEVQTEQESSTPAIVNAEDEFSQPPAQLVDEPPKEENEPVVVETEAAQEDVPAAPLSKKDKKKAKKAAKRGSIVDSEPPTTPATPVEEAKDPLLVDPSPPPDPDPPAEETPAPMPANEKPLVEPEQTEDAAPLSKKDKKKAKKAKRGSVAEDKQPAAEASQDPDAFLASETGERLVGDAERHVGGAADTVQAGQVVERSLEEPRAEVNISAEVEKEPGQGVKPEPEAIAAEPLSSSPPEAGDTTVLDESQGTPEDGGTATSAKKGKKGKKGTKRESIVEETLAESPVVADLVHTDVLTSEAAFEQTHEDIPSSGPITEPALASSLEPAIPTTEDLNKDVQVEALSTADAQPGEIAATEPETTSSSQKKKKGKKSKRASTIDEPLSEAAAPEPTSEQLTGQQLTEEPSTVPEASQAVLPEVEKISEDPKSQNDVQPSDVTTEQDVVQTPREAAFEDATADKVNETVAPVPSEDVKVEEATVSEEALPAKLSKKDKKKARKSKSQSGSATPVPEAVAGVESGGVVEVDTPLDSVVPIDVPSEAVQEPSSTLQEGPTEEQAMPMTKDDDAVQVTEAPVQDQPAKSEEPLLSQVQDATITHSETAAPAQGDDTSAPLTTNDEPQQAADDEWAGLSKKDKKKAKKAKAKRSGTATPVVEDAPQTPVETEQPALAIQDHPTLSRTEAPVEPVAQEELPQIQSDEVSKDVATHEMVESGAAIEETVRETALPEPVPTVEETVLPVDEHREIATATPDVEQPAEEESTSMSKKAKKKAKKGKGKQSEPATPIVDETPPVQAEDKVSISPTEAPAEEPLRVESDVQQETTREIVPELPQELMSVDPTSESVNKDVPASDAPEDAPATPSAIETGAQAEDELAGLSKKAKKKAKKAKGKVSEPSKPITEELANVQADNSQDTVPTVPGIADVPQSSEPTNISDIVDVSETAQSDNVRVSHGESTVKPVSEPLSEPVDAMVDEWAPLPAKKKGKKGKKSGTATPVIETATDGTAIVSEEPSKDPVLAEVQPQFQDIAEPFVDTTQSRGIIDEPKINETENVAVPEAKQEVVDVEEGAVITGKKKKGKKGKKSGASTPVVEEALASTSVEEALPEKSGDDRVTEPPSATLEDSSATAIVEEMVADTAAQVPIAPSVDMAQPPESTNEKGKGKKSEEETPTSETIIEPALHDQPVPEAVVEVDASANISEEVVPEPQIHDITTKQPSEEQDSVKDAISQVEQPSEVRSEEQPRVDQAAEESKAPEPPALEAVPDPEDEPAAPMSKKKAKKNKRKASLATPVTEEVPLRSSQPEHDVSTREEVADKTVEDITDAASGPVVERDVPTVSAITDPSAEAEAEDEWAAYAPKKKDKKGKGKKSEPQTPVAEISEPTIEPPVEPVFEPTAEPMGVGPEVSTNLQPTTDDKIESASTESAIADAQVEPIEVTATEKPALERKLSKKEKKAKKKAAAFYLNDESVAEDTAQVSTSILADVDETTHLPDVTTAELAAVEESESLAAETEQTTLQDTPSVDFPSLPDTPAEAITAPDDSQSKDLEAADEWSNFAPKKSKKGKKDKKTKTTEAFEQAIEQPTADLVNVSKEVASETPFESAPIESAAAADVEIGTPNLQALPQPAETELRTMDEPNVQSNNVENEPQASTKPIQDTLDQSLPKAATTEEPIITLEGLPEHKEPEFEVEGAPVTRKASKKDKKRAKKAEQSNTEAFDVTTEPDVATTMEPPQQNEAIAAVEPEVQLEPAVAASLTAPVPDLVPITDPPQAVQNEEQDDEWTLPVKKSKKDRKKAKKSKSTSEAATPIAEKEVELSSEPLIAEVPTTPVEEKLVREEKLPSPGETTKDQLSEPIVSQSAVPDGPVEIEQSKDEPITVASSESNMKSMEPNAQQDSGINPSTDEAETSPLSPSLQALLDEAADLRQRSEALDKQFSTDDVLESAASKPESMSDVVSKLSKKDKKRAKEGKNVASEIPAEAMPVEPEVIVNTRDISSEAEHSVPATDKDIDMIPALEPTVTPVEISDPVAEETTSLSRKLSKKDKRKAKQAALAWDEPSDETPEPSAVSQDNEIAMQNPEPTVVPETKMAEEPIQVQEAVDDTPLLSRKLSKKDKKKAKQQAALLDEPSTEAEVSNDHDISEIDPQVTAHDPVVRADKDVPEVAPDFKETNEDVPPLSRKLSKKEKKKAKATALTWDEPIAESSEPVGLADARDIQPSSIEQQATTVHQDAPTISEQEFGEPTTVLPEHDVSFDKDSATPIEPPPLPVTEPEPISEEEPKVAPVVEEDAAVRPALTRKQSKKDKKKKGKAAAHESYEPSAPVLESSPVVEFFDAAPSDKKGKKELSTFEWEDPAKSEVPENGKDKKSSETATTVQDMVTTETAREVPTEPLPASEAPTDRSLPPIDEPQAPEFRSVDDLTSQPQDQATAAIKESGKLPEPMVVDEIAEGEWALPSKKSKKEKRKSKNAATALDTPTPLVEAASPEATVVPATKNIPSVGAKESMLSRDASVPQPNLPAPSVSSQATKKKNKKHKLAAMFEPASPEEAEAPKIGPLKVQEEPIHGASAILPDTVTFDQPGAPDALTKQSRASSPAQDIDFAATVAAGLKESGFDTDLVLSDPLFHRSTSPQSIRDIAPDDDIAAARHGASKSKFSTMGRSPSPTSPKVEVSVQKEASQPVVAVASETVPTFDPMEVLNDQTFTQRKSPPGVLEEADPEELWSSNKKGKKAKGKKKRVSLAQDNDGSSAVEAPVIEAPTDVPFAVETPADPSAKESLRYPSDLSMTQSTKVSSASMDNLPSEQNLPETSHETADTLWDKQPKEKGQKPKSSLERAVTAEPMHEASTTSSATDIHEGSLEKQKSMVTDVSDVEMRADESKLSAGGTTKKNGQKDRTSAAMAVAAGAAAIAAVASRERGQVKEKDDFIELPPTFDQHPKTLSGVEPKEYPFPGLPTPEERKSSDILEKAAREEEDEWASPTRKRERKNKKKREGKGKEENVFEKSLDATTNNQKPDVARADIIDLPPAGPSLKQEGARRASPHPTKRREHPVPPEAEPEEKRVHLSGPSQHDLSLPHQSAPLTSAHTRDSAKPNIERSSVDVPAPAPSRGHAPVVEPTWSFGDLRDSAIHVADSSMVPSAPQLPENRDIRDSGYHDEAFETPKKSKGSSHALKRNDDNKKRQSREPETPRQSRTLERYEEPRSRSPSLPELPSLAAVSSPNAVDSATKERASYLFDSSPSTRHYGESPPAKPKSRSDDITMAGAAAMGAAAVAAAASARKVYDSPSHEKHAASVSQRQQSSPTRDVKKTEPYKSIFGDPNEKKAEQSRQLSTPSHKHARTPSSVLDPIKEASPDDSHSQKKHARKVSDAGLPDREVKSARRSQSPKSFSERMKSPPPVTPTPASRKSIPSKIDTSPPVNRKASPWQQVHESVDRTMTLSPARRLPHDNSPSSTDPIKVRIAEQRSPSDRSDRPLSAASNRSTSSLRRVDRSRSGDLRSAAKIGEARAHDAKSQPNLAGIALAAGATAAIVSGIASSSKYDPVKDKGKGRAEMPDVYVSSS